MTRSGQSDLEQPIAVRPTSGYCSLPGGRGCRTFTWKPRLESGLDCRMCAIFARQREVAWVTKSGQSDLGQLIAVRPTSGYYLPRERETKKKSVCACVSVGVRESLCECRCERCECRCERERDHVRDVEAGAAHRCPHCQRMLLAGFPVTISQ